MADKANESVSASGNTVRPLTQPELEALTADLQAVLEKHGAEMGVTSTINLMKVVEDEPETKPENKDGEAEPAEEAKESETDSEAESSS